MKRGFTITYSIHHTPLRPGESVQTYHVRHEQERVIHTKELRQHIASYTIISEGLFEMVVDTLKRELAEQLLMGNGVHLDGIGRFSLQLGTKKVTDEHGRRHPKTYTDPKALTADELTIDGISFVPDKEMTDRLDGDSRRFALDKFAYRHNITRAELLTTLATLCRDRGSFTRSDFQRIFNVSRYKADQILADLVSEPYPKYYRQKRGKAWLYRKTGT